MRKMISLILIILVLGVTIDINAFSKQIDVQTERRIVEKIETMFNAIYSSRDEIEYYDLSSVLDMNSKQSSDKIVTVKRMVQGLKIMQNNGDVVRRSLRADIEVVNSFIREGKVHITVKLIPNINLEKAYYYEYGFLSYPIFAQLGLHEFELNSIGGDWKISKHSYDTKDEFELSSSIFSSELNIEEIREMNKWYQTGVIEELVSPTADDGISYRRDLAVSYANTYVINNNTNYYNANVAGGDCTNFVSQAVRAGFTGTNSGISNKSIMDHKSSYTYSQGWYAGSGGGSSAWENVGAFYTYITNQSKSLGPTGSSTTKNNMLNGDVMQLGNNGNYSHTVILVDKANWKFAQHTSNGYRTYEDYATYANKRFIKLSVFKHPLGCTVSGGVILCPTIGEFE